MKSLKLLLVLTIGLLTACNSTPDPGSFELTALITKLTFRLNSSLKLPINVNRLAGFTGDINVFLTGNPSGFTADPLVIHNPDSSGTLVVHSSAALGSSTPLSVKASSGSMASLQSTTGQVLPFTTSLLDSSVVLAPGTSFKTKILIGRASDFTDPVVVTLNNLPTGVTSSGVTIPAGTTSGDLTLTASSSALETVGSLPITFTASSGANSETWNATLAVQLKAGMLDPAFGVNGVSRGTEPFDSTSAANQNGIKPWFIQPDGKVVIFNAVYSSGINLTRWNTDATLDTSFGSGGTVILTNNLQNYSSPLGQASIQIYPNGDLLVIESKFLQTTFIGPNGIQYNGTEYKLQLWRIASTGAPVTSFGTNGTVLIEDPSATKFFYSGTLLPNEKIMIVGEGNRNLNLNSQSLFRKLNSDGTLDTNFGTNGDLLLGNANPTTGNALRAVTVLSDGSVLGLGTSGKFGLNGLLIRIDPNTGVPTPGFGTGGIQTLADVVGNKVLENAGKLYLLVGTGAIRLNSNGTIDPTYDVTLGTGTFVSDGLFGTDGSLILCGYNADAIFAKFTPSGLPDFNFGTAGRSTIPKRTNEPEMVAIKVFQTGDRLTVYGLAGNFNLALSTTHVVIARVKY